MNRGREEAQKSLLISYVTGKVSFQNIKERHHERSIKQVLASQQSLN
jgi:hypothetical protein